jgi:hypothetical protein
VARRDRRTTDVPLEEDVRGGGLALDTDSPIPPTGPHDSEDLDPEVTEAAGLVDFGSIRVPVPAEGTVTVEPTAGDRMQAVHIRMPEGRLSVSALAAPKSSKLWPDLAREIDASLREGGARVRSFTGDWGRELHATSGGATSVFIGVDGPRWMLYGVATGPSAHSAPLEAELRRMLRGTVVVRGKQPYPARTILPLTMPEHLAEEAAATPVVAAPGTRKRSQPKAAPGKAAPGKTAPPKSDAGAAAAKKAAARRAAARKAAAAAAVKAAAEVLAERAAEDRSTAGTIATGPGPDAPLREQAPSARRAAASAWRTRPAAPGRDASPVEDPPVTEAIPAAELPPTEALRAVEPGTGGRRRLGEPAVPPAPPPGGRRHLPEPPVEQSYPGGRRRLREPAPGEPPAQVPPPGARRPAARNGATGDWGVSDTGGRRRLREPVADPGATGRRHLREPWDAEPRGGASPWTAEPAEPSWAGGEGGVSASGRRRLREPWEDRPSVAPPADAGVSASGRRRLPDPWAAEPPRAPRTSEPGPAADTGVSASGRRRLREPWDAPEPAAPAADSGVSASGRRYLREPWDTGPGGVNGTGGRRHLVEPPPSDAGVSGTGRRHLREPWDANGAAPPPAGGRRGPEPFPAPGPAAQGPAPSGRRALGDPWDDGGPALDRGVPASGRRRLREPWDAPEQAAPVADSGVSASGRRYLREPWDAGPGGVNGGVNGGVDGTGGRRHLAEPPPDPGISGTGGRRRLREPEPPPARDGARAEPWAFPRDAGARPRRAAEHLVETGERDAAGWADAFADRGERRDGGGRHAGDPATSTVRLQALLSELDPNRPRRRHRR